MAALSFQRNQFAEPASRARRRAELLGLALRQLHPRRSDHFSRKVRQRVPQRAVLVQQRASRSFGIQLPERIADLIPFLRDDFLIDRRRHARTYRARRLLQLVGIDVRLLDAPIRVRRQHRHHAQQQDQRQSSADSHRPCSISARTIISVIASALITSKPPKFPCQLYAFRLSRGRAAYQGTMPLPEWEFLPRISLPPHKTSDESCNADRSPQRLEQDSAHLT